MASSDSDSDFVEISAQSSDSEWEKIDFEGDVEAPVVQTQTSEGTTATNKKRPRKVRRRNGGKKTLFVAPLEQVLISKDVISPDAGVELLGVNGEEVSLLSTYSVATVGQLACFDVAAIFPADHKSIARLLELQEKASEIAMEYITKMSYTNVVWGYCYLREIEQVRVLKQGFISADSLQFLLTSIPLDIYRNTIAVDRLSGDSAVVGRYSHLIKVNLTQVCKEYNADLYVKEANAWIPLQLADVEAWVAKPGMWDNYTPGTDLYQSVTHGKIVLPSNKVPIECLEFDVTHSSKSRQAEEKETKEEEDEEDIPHIEYANKRDYAMDYVPKKSNIFGREGSVLQANIAHRSSKNNR